mgnify:FL=1
MMEINGFGGVVRNVCRKLISVLFIIVLIILCIISNKETVLENVTDEYKKEVVTEAVIEENKIASAKELIKNAVSKEIILKSTDITEKNIMSY